MCTGGKINVGTRTVTKEVNGIAQSVQEPHCADEDNKGNISFRSAIKDTNESKKYQKH